MTYPEWMAARQLLSEEFLGVYVRQRNHDEDKSFSKTAARLPRG